MRGKTVVKNIPGTIRAVDTGKGFYEFQKEPDVLCIRPKRKNRIKQGAILTAGAVGIVGGAVLAILYLAPAFGTILFALLAVCLFGKVAYGE